MDSLDPRMLVSLNTGFHHFEAGMGGACEALRDSETLSCSWQPLIGSFQLIVQQTETDLDSEVDVWSSGLKWTRGELDFYTGTITGNWRVQLGPGSHTHC